MYTFIVNNTCFCSLGWSRTTDRSHHRRFLLSRICI